MLLLLQKLLLDCYKVLVLHSVYLQLQLLLDLPNDHITATLLNSMRLPLRFTSGHCILTQSSKLLNYYLGTRSSLSFVSNFTNSKHTII